jgi:hypothetical protein
MSLGQTGHVAVTALEIDCDWGVWIDSNAEVAGQQSLATPITVHRIQEGYAIDLRYVAQGRKQVWENQPGHTSFDGRGFVPVSNIL